MKVLIVIPVYNPPQMFLSDVLPRLRTQSVQTDILIINSGSPIPTDEHEVINIDKKAFNHANTRNMALNYEADFYLFMTQDATPYNNQLISELTKVFSDPEVVAAYARQIPYADADPIERFARETNYPPDSKVKSIKDLPELGIKTFFSSDSCAMYRGSYFRNIGGFKKDLNTNEDMEFASRAIMDGKKVAYCADAMVYHSHQFTFLQIWNRYCEIGTFFARHKSILDIVSEYSKAESTGIKQALSELKHLALNAPAWIPRSILTSGLKFVAFKYAMSKHRNG